MATAVHNGIPMFFSRLNGLVCITAADCEQNVFNGTSRFAKGVLRLRGGMDSPDQSNEPVRSDSSPATSRESTSDDDDTKETATECFNESARSMYDYLPLMVRQPIIVSDRIGRINSLIQILVPGIAIRHHFNNMDSTVRKVQRRVLRSVKNAADDLRSLITFYGNAQPGTEDRVKFDNLSSLQEELALFVAHFERYKKNHTEKHKLIRIAFKNVSEQNNQHLQ